MKFSMIRAPRTRIVALMLALGLAVPSAPAQLHAQLPALGDAGDLSVSTERRIGDRVARELFRDPDYLDDAILSDYLDSLWQPLLAAARQRGEELLKALNDNEVLDLLAYLLSRGDPAHETYSKRAMARDVVAVMEALGHVRVKMGE